MTRMTTGALRRGMKTTLDRAARKGERFIIERRGKAVAALVPIEDLEVLEAFEDQRPSVSWRTQPRSPSLTKGSTRARAGVTYPLEAPSWF